MKKIIVILMFLSMLVACGIKNKASDAVKEYLNKYNNQQEVVLKELESVIEKEKYTDTQKKVYKEVMIKQYKDLQYKIADENYNGDEATVKVKLTVYDLYNAQKEAEKYKNDNREYFKNQDGNYDASKFLDYKLEQMKKTTKTIDYTIDFKVHKKDGVWTLDTISEESLEKIHGIYNYAND